MFAKFNVWGIVRSHFDTFRDFSSARVLPLEIGIFIGIPAAVSALVLFGLRFTITQVVANILVTSLSIFSALLFNLLLLVYDIVNRKDRKEPLSPKREALRTTLLEQTYNNIAFSILASVIALIVLLLTYLPWPFLQPQIIGTLSALVYFLVTMFMLTVFMILKRVHVLLSKEIQDASTT